MLLVVQQMKVLGIFYQTKHLFTLVCYNMISLIVLIFVSHDCTKMAVLIYLYLYLVAKAMQIPLTTDRLYPLLESKCPYIEKNADSVVSIIRHSIQMSSAYEAAVKHLKEMQMGLVSFGVHAQYFYLMFLCKQSLCWEFLIGSFIYLLSCNF